MRRTSGTQLAQNGQVILVVCARVETYRSRMATPISSAHSGVDAVAMIRGATWIALVIEADIPGAAEVIREARARDAVLPVLVVGALGPSGSDLLVYSCPNPAPDAILEVFELEAMRRGATLDQRVEDTVKAWAHQFRLTPTESKILVLSARVLDRQTIASMLGHAPATLDTHVKSLLRKLTADSLKDAVILLLLEANGVRPARGAAGR